ncbi:monocarboxylate transporter 9-like [Diadema antillarum]|uniref:monocarboxylate transporter 9-like n=1 Tax=Diadema antillarum TaxID=105358 RepID=UPI003A85B264
MFRFSSISAESSKKSSSRGANHSREFNSQKAHGKRADKVHGQGLKRWLILAGVSLNSFLENGVIRSMGLILNDLTFQLNSSTTFVATMISLSHGAVYWLGLGFSNVILISNSSPAHYFPDLFEFASGISLCGGAVGLMVLPILFEVFFESFGWRGAVLLLGALTVHSVVVGALLRPANQAAEESLTEVKLDSNDFEPNTEAGSNVTSSQTATPTDDETFDTMEDNREHTNIGFEDDEQVENNATNAEIIRENQPSLVDADQSEKQQNVFDICNLSETPDDSISMREEVCGPGLDDPSECKCTEDVNLRTSSHSEQDEDKSSTFVLCRVFTFIVKTFELQLFRKHPLLIVLCIYSVFFGMTYNGLIQFAIPNVQAKGLGEKSVYVSLAGGIGDALGRVGFGLLASRRWMHIEQLNLIFCLLSAGAFFANLLAESFWLLTILAFVNGLTLGGKLSSVLILLKEAVGIDHYKAAAALIYFTVDIGSPIGGAILGSVFDATQSHDVSFSVLGVIDILGGLLVALSFTWSLRRKSRK